jgi:class 3 adenylate cyclase
MQDALRAAQTNRGDDRIAMRVVIALGDVAFDQGELIGGDTLALMVRVEDITPADEIYLSPAARFAVASTEIQTGLVGNFTLQGFAGPISVYRVEQRQRTQIIADAYILVSDIRGFTQATEILPVAVIESLLDTLEALTRKVADEFEGTIRFSVGDGYCLTFPDAVRLIAAAERLVHAWKAERRDEWSNCAVTIALHRGKINVFRSFLYGEGYLVAARLASACVEVLADNEGGIFATGPLRDALNTSAWHNLLRPVEIKRVDHRFAKLETYRLDGVVRELGTDD